MKKQTLKQYEKLTAEKENDEGGLKYSKRLKNID